MGGIPWHWDMEAGVKTRTLEESSPASSWMPGRKSSFPAANLMQRQILLPSISRNHNFIFILFFLIFSPLVRCLFALLSLHLCITFFSVPQNTSQGLAAGKYNQSNSYYFSMFHTVVFLLLLVFFFFFLSPPFFLRLEQIQYDWQEIGRLQRSRGSDFSSK